MMARANRRSQSVSAFGQKAAVRLAGFLRIAPHAVACRRSVRAIPAAMLMSARFPALRDGRRHCAGIAFP